MIGHTTETKFKHMVKKTLRNFSVKVEYVTNKLSIFGPDLAGVRGKKVITKPYLVEMDVVQIPRDFYKLNKFVTLTEDVMFTNCVSFMNTISRNTRSFTAEYVPSYTTAQLGNYLNKRFILYY